MIDNIKIECEANYENAAPNNSDEYSKQSEQTIKKDVDKEYRKMHKHSLRNTTWWLV